VKGRKNRSRSGSPVEERACQRSGSPTGKPKSRKDQGDSKSKSRTRDASLSSGDDKKDKKPTKQTAASDSEGAASADEKKKKTKKVKRDKKSKKSKSKAKNGE